MALSKPVAHGGAGLVPALAWAGVAAILAVIAASTPHMRLDLVLAGAAWCGVGTPDAGGLASLLAPGHCPACYGTILAGLASIIEAILWAGRQAGSLAGHPAMQDAAA